MSTIFSERLFAKHEKEFRPFLAQAGLPEAILRRPDIEMPVDKYMELLDLVACNSNPAIGLIMGESIEPPDLGVYGHAMAAAADVGQCLRVMSQYLYVFAQANSIRVDTAQNWTVVSYRHFGPLARAVVHDIAFATSGIISLLRKLTGRAIVPRLVDFEHAKPGHSREYGRVFGCEVRFNRRGNRIHLDRGVLSHPLLTSDPSLLAALEFSLNDRLKLRSDEDDLVLKVNHLISATLSDGHADIDNVAAKLGLSRRTLQRKLAAEGQVFSDMVEAIRRSVAMEYVKHSDYSLTDIAMMLGYGELSSLSRAFRRWTGQSPNQLRT